MTATAMPKAANSWVLQQNIPNAQLTSTPTPTTARSTPQRFVRHVGDILSEDI